MQVPGLGFMDGGVYHVGWTEMTVLIRKNIFTAKFLVRTTVKLVTATKEQRPLRRV